MTEHEHIYNADDSAIDGMLSNTVTSDGQKLVYVGNNLWVPESCTLKEEDREKYAARFSHPVINKKAVVLQLLFPPLVCAVLVAAFGLSVGRYSAWAGNPLILIAIAAGLLLLYSFIRLKSIIIFWVQVYQVKAPMSVRERCALIPTCSDYMILAVRKYGAIKGLIKGIKRLRRCNGTPGEDWP